MDGSGQVKAQVRLPGDTDRLTVVGSTGSGKTRFGSWLLSTRNFHVKPWVVFDFKGEELFDKIGATFIKITDAPPTKPGVYIVRPFPHEIDDGLVDAFLWKCWAQGDIGLYFDEGYMVGNRSKPFRALLTQGRSKHIPMIILSQRPVWMDRFVFSEATFFAVFRLTDTDDVKTVQRMVKADLNKRLPRYCSYWYDVGEDCASVFKPVPNDQAIIDAFSARLPGRKSGVKTI